MMTFKTKRRLFYIVILVIIAGLAVGGYWFYKTKEFKITNFKNYPFQTKGPFSYNTVIGDENGDDSSTIFIKKANRLNKVEVKNQNTLTYTGENQKSIVSIQLGDKASTNLELYDFVIKSDKNDKVKVRIYPAQTEIHVRATNGKQFFAALNAMDAKDEVDNNPFDSKSNKYYTFPTNANVVFKLVSHDKRKEKYEWKVYVDKKLSKMILAE